MSTRHTTRLLTTIAVALALTPALVAAQASDVRDIRPAIVLMVDTSGSMERLSNCECTTAACNECFPRCTGTTGAGDERNRWATVLEALTGSWPDSAFACTETSRAAFLGDDATYPMPHFATPGATGQLPDGILDTYAARAKFALMTFDGIPTLVNGPELLPFVNYATHATAMRGASGGYSYGAVASGFDTLGGGFEPWLAPSYPFRFPGCTEANGYLINVGAKRALEGSETLATIPGALMTVGSDADFLSTNQAIQSSLLSVRPYGPTPIAGMLEDLRFYLHDDASIGPANATGTRGDTFFDCRKRFGLLITDGMPNADMRGAPFNCETAGAGPGGYPTPRGAASARSSWCPYDLPRDIAAALCEPDASGTCSEDADLDGLFVIGLNVPDEAAPPSSGTCTSVRCTLNEIAARGGTERAYFADDLESLRDAIAAVLNVAAPGTTSRTTPAFAASALTASTPTMSQFATGFQIDDPGEPWSGVLTRKRFLCDATSLQPEPEPTTAADRFHETLDANGARELWTVAPNDPALVTGHLIGMPNRGVDDEVIRPLSTTVSGGNGAAGQGAGGLSCTNGAVTATPVPTTGTDDELTRTAFEISNGSLSRAHLSAPTDADRDAIIDWVRGDNGSRDSRMGDIYHSSPAVVSSPNMDIADESFNEFRRLGAVANRPTVVYVGTNDGVLHAFAAEDMDIVDGPHVSDEGEVDAGEELWGFVPPAIFPRLNGARSSHQLLVDGSPLVKDVYFQRMPQGGADPDLYHTVLLVGLRGGGGAYVALDVTDPFEPKFLWQFAHGNMGPTMGTPAMGQVLVKTDGNNLEERAVAFLPGGAGEDFTSLCSGTEPVPGETGATRRVGCPSRGLVGSTTGALGARSNYRCWSPRGRGLFVVDVATGQLIKHFDDRVFGAPLSGGVALFTGDVGTVASRAYLTDADGVIWRVDVSNPDVSRWSATPVFDMYHGAGGADGQPSFSAPVLSTDAAGNVVVIQATGDVDTLDGDPSISNRVASVTDVATFSEDGSAAFTPTLNWEIVLSQGELVTGPLQLFDGRVYFATFDPSTSESNACEFGNGYLWGVDYVESSGGRAPVGEMVQGDGTLAVKNPAYTNQLILGVAIAQDLTCADWQSVERYDPYVPLSTPVPRAANVNPGGFRLVAQVSGGAGASAGSVQEVSIDLTPPTVTTRIQGWAGHAD